MRPHGSCAAHFEPSRPLDEVVFKRARGSTAGCPVTALPRLFCSRSHRRVAPHRARALVGRILLLAAFFAAGPSSRAAETEAARATTETLAATETASIEPVCAEGSTLATGPADPTIIARDASRGVQALWCETYDASGAAHRSGPYQDRYAGGQLRVRASYLDGRFEGPVEIYDEEGALWVRGRLAGGEWSGELTLFHANGQPWFVAHFEAGRIAGPALLHRPDGSPEPPSEREAPAEIHAAR